MVQATIPMVSAAIPSLKLGSPDREVERSPSQPETHTLTPYAMRAKSLIMPHLQHMLAGVGFELEQLPWPSHSGCLGLGRLRLVLWIADRPVVGWEYCRGVAEMQLGCPCTFGCCQDTCRTGRRSLLDHPWLRDGIEWRRSAESCE